MLDAELRCAREWLGLSDEWLAAHHGVELHTLRQWEAGTSPIPDSVRLTIKQLEELTAGSVDTLISMFVDRPHPKVSVYRSDAEYHTAAPGAVMPASWHRMVVMRTANELPGLSIVYTLSPAASTTLSI
jgi:hypothetical protein